MRSESPATEGAQLQPLNPPPRRKIFFDTVRGISFLPHVCTLKMLKISWGIQICMQNF